MCSDNLKMCGDKRLFEQLLKQTKNIRKKNRNGGYEGRGGEMGQREEWREGEERKGGKGKGWRRQGGTFVQ